MSAPWSPTPGLNGLVSSGYLVCCPLFQRAFVLFLKAAGSVFCLSLVCYWINPRYASLALGRLLSLYEHHFDLLQAILSDLALIALNNAVAVLIGVGLGSLAVWWILTEEEMQAPRRALARCWLTRLGGWLADGVVGGVHRLALRVHPHLRQVPSLALQQTVAVSVLPPVLSLLVNGALMGIWSAWYFTRHHWLGLGRAVVGILPHGVIELPALWAAAAAGLSISDGLIRAGRQGPQEVRQALRALIRSRALWRTCAALLLMITTAAVLETRVSWELQEKLLDPLEAGVLP